MKKPEVFAIAWKDHHGSKFKTIGSVRLYCRLHINQKNKIRNNKIMRYNKMSKLIRRDFSYPDTQEQGHNKRNKSSNSHVLYLQCSKRWQERQKFWLSTMQLLEGRGGGLTSGHNPVGFTIAYWIHKRNEKNKPKDFECRRMGKCWRGFSGLSA